MNYKVTSIALYQLAFLNAPGKVGHLVIPETVQDGQGTTFTVTGVTFMGGYNCDNITSVKLPESITYLDAGIFKDASLETINIPKNVKRIFCVVMLGLTNVNILYYSFSTLYQMCNLRYNHIRVCDFFP